MIIHNIEQGSEAWFAIKAGKVTGTRFKALVAGESTATYKDLVDDITCEIITGKIEETYTNAVMQKTFWLPGESIKMSLQIRHGFYLN